MNLLLFFAILIISFPVLYFVMFAPSFVLMLILPKPEEDSKPTFFTHLIGNLIGLYHLFIRFIWVFFTSVLLNTVSQERHWLLKILLFGICLGAANLPFWERKRVENPKTLDLIRETLGFLFDVIFIVLFFVFYFYEPSLKYLVRSVFRFLGVEVPE